MCSYETEKRLGKILMLLAEGERSIEISRQVLSDLKEFDSFQIFKNIDMEDKNKIDCFTLINFLRIKGIYCTEEEASLIILFYDQDYDNALSYSEFINLIQSDKVLKKSLNISPKDKIPFNIDYSLTKLLEKEVELARTIINSLQDIKCRYDFNIHNLFLKLKYFNSVTNESIKNFLESNGISYLESDIKSIIKRLDLNKDGIIDLCEFQSILGFPDCIYCCPCVNCNSCEGCLCESCYSDVPYHTPEIYQNKNYIQDTNEKDEFDFHKYNHTMGEKLNNDDDMNYKLSRNFNIINKYETSLGNNIKEKESMNISNSLHLRTSPRRKYSPIEIYLNKNENLNMNFNLNEIEKNQFNDFLILLMAAETEIEEIKKELAKQEDFNCGDAFLIFDKDNKGYITKEDFKSGLYLFNINVDDYLINIVFKRFDLTKKSELNFADFFDMLIPFEKIYRNNIEQRPPKSTSQKQSLELLSKETKEIFKNVLDIIIKYEIEINEKRKEINILMRKLKDIFYLFDKDGIGFFGFDEYINFMKDNNLIKDNILNPDLLFIRLDKYRNGKIVFEEFADEFQAIY